MGLTVSLTALFNGVAYLEAGHFAVAMSHRQWWGQ